MSEYVPQPPEATPEPAEEDPWHVAFDEFKDRDIKMVKDYQEEIDTLLVFVRSSYCLFSRGLTPIDTQAGLFSAVLTAFVAQSYQSLSENYNQTSADLLWRISHQLANSSFPAAPERIVFQAQSSDIQVNVCWFVSLLFSLVVALFSLFLKQWMRTYMKWTEVTSYRDAVALRQFRYRALERWHLGAILALLPTLLKLAVVLFLAGLLLFLWKLNQIVADVMGALSCTVFLFVATVTVLPVISVSCPYRSTLTEVVALPLRYIPRCFKIVRSAARAFVNAGWTCSPSSAAWIDHDTRRRYWSESVLPTSWRQADEDIIDQYNKNGNHVTIHSAAMIRLCRTTQSPRFWFAAITAVMAEYSEESIMRFLTSTKFFHYEVWWPILNHLFPLRECMLDPTPDHPWSDRNRFCRVFGETYSHWKSFSLPMKRRWLEFMLLWKGAVCKESVPNSVVTSYLLFCIIYVEDTRDGRCVLALMEVLAHQHLKLHVQTLDHIAYLLFSQEQSWISNPVLWGSSGVSFAKLPLSIGLSTCHRAQVHQS
jgi:hypothetical protein